MSKLLIMAIIAIILGIFFKHSRIVSLYMCAILWIIMGWQSGTADMYNYGVLYRSSVNIHFISMMQSPLYNLFNYLLNKSGAPFQYVYIIGSLISIIALYIAICRFTDEQNYALSLFLISTYLLYAVQIRNFMALPYILLAVDSLTEDHRSYIRFIIFILIASGFHISAIFYIFLILIPRLNKKQTLIYTVVVSGLAYISAGSWMRIAQSGRSVEYKLFSGDVLTTLIYDLLVLIGIVLVIFEYLMIEKDIDNGQYDLKKQLNKMDLIAKINIFMLIMIPLQSVSIEFVRLYRNILVLDFISCSYSIKLGFDGKIHSLIYRYQFKHLIWNILLIFYAFVYGNLYIYRQCYESVFLPIFSMNLLVH